MLDDDRPLITRREALLLPPLMVAAWRLEDLDAQTPPDAPSSPEALGSKPPGFAPSMAWEFDLRIQWDGRHPTGVFNAGQRIFNVATGGEFAGPHLRGRVVPGGGDWALMRPADAPFDGKSPVERLFTFDARYLLQASDGIYIYVTNRGYGSRAADAGEESPKRRSLSTPVFEVPVDSPYGFLSRNVYIAISEARDADTIMHVYRATA